LVEIQRDSIPLGNFSSVSASILRRKKQLAYWAGLGYVHRQQAGRWVLVACQMEGEVSQGGPRGEKQKREKMWAGWRIDQMVFILFNGFSFFWFDSIQN
jgi:hypothetical protein